MAGFYKCNDCGIDYARGRGRPPKVALCSACTNARWAKGAGRLSGTIKITKISADLDERPSVKEPFRGKPTDKQVHGATGTAVTSPCPKCNYAYADGGYCQECGWTLPIKRHDYGSVTGRKFR